MNLRISQIAIIGNIPVQFLKDDICPPITCTYTVYKCRLLLL